MKFFVFLTAFSSLFLNRFGVNIIGDFSLSFSYIFLYISIALGIQSNRLFVNIGCFILFIFICFLGGISFIYGQSFKSLSSLFLFYFVYLPFIFEKRIKTTSLTNFFKLYLPFFLVIGTAGILQFFLQFIFRPDWLFDYRPFIPDFFRNKNAMNTVIPFEGFIKSNGFFLLEPSGFSQLMSLGLYFVCISSASLAYFLIFFIGLCISFSVTGLILFILSSIFAVFNSFSYRRFISLLFLLGFIFFTVLYRQSSVLSRVSEFSAGTQLETSSAAARFINPIISLKEFLFKSPLDFLFGQGPGTITRIETDYKAHDPVWAKLFFEYGFAGGLLFLFFIFFSVSKECNRKDLCFLFFVQWFFLGGHLLSLDVVTLYIVYYKLSGYE